LTPDFPVRAFRIDAAKDAMRHKLRTEAGQAIYKMRKAIVEPVLGQTKERRVFRRFGGGGRRVEPTHSNAG
jgi:hypothetical protein